MNRKRIERLRNNIIRLPVVNGPMVELINAILEDAPATVGTCEEVQTDINGWIPWHWGECPVEDFQRVVVRFRDGKETAETFDACDLDWDHSNGAIDIVAYRLHRTESVPAAQKEPDKFHLTPEAVVEIMLDADCPPEVGEIHMTGGEARTLVAAVRELAWMLTHGSKGPEDYDRFDNGLDLARAVVDME